MTGLEKLIHKKISRRDLFKKSGKASAFLTIGSILPKEFLELELFRKKIFNSDDGLSFTPIEPSMEDSFILPEGFKYEIIRMWGDKINDTEYFGFNNDFVGFIPLDFLHGGNNSNDGLLVVNHEYPSPLFINNYTDEDFKNGRIKTKEEVDKEKMSVGISIFRVKRKRSRLF